MTKKNEKDHIEEMLDEEELEEQMDSGKEAEDELDELSLLKQKLKEAEDRVIRNAADTDNYIKRLNKETDEKIKYANQSLITKFLPVLDNFDLTLQHGEASTVETLMEGVKLNQKVMVDTLAKVGLTEVEATVGEAFDPNTQEAIMLTNNPDMPDGCVTMVLQKGYILEGRIVRPAKVQVNKLS